MNLKYVIPGIVIILFLCIIPAFAEEASAQNQIPAKVSIADLMNAPEKYTSASISLEGKITSQCGSGCWFILTDDTGDLYINLKPNNFVIPPAMGKKVIVNGSAIIKDNDVALIGSSVDLEGKTYP